MFYPDKQLGQEKGDNRMATINTSYMQRVHEELDKDVEFRNWQNEKQPVYSRQMTEEEMTQIFGGNPDYIKNISRNSDGQEWRKIK